MVATVLRLRYRILANMLARNVWQLVGCTVTTEDGREIGRVTGIEPAPAQDLWAVSDGTTERLIPAVPEIVIDVSLAERRVVIRPPDGLLDL